MMNECLRCKKELMKDLDVYAEGAFQVEVSDKKRVLTKHRAKVKAAVCPICGEVSLYLEGNELGKIIRDVEAR